MQKKPMPPRFLVKEITSPPAAARQNFGSVRQKQQQAVSSNYINAPNNNYINNNNNSSSNNYNGKNGTASNYVEEYYIDNTNNQKQSTKLLATSNISDNRNGPSYVRNENTTQSPYEAIPNQQQGNGGYYYNNNPTTNSNNNNQPTLEGLANMDDHRDRVDSFPPVPEVTPPPPPTVSNNSQQLSSSLNQRPSNQHSPHYLVDTVATTELQKQSPKHFHAEEHHANHIHHLSDEQVKHNVSYYEDVRRNHLHSSKNHEDTVAGGWMEVLQNGLKIPKDHDAIEALRITHQRQRVNPYGRKSKKIHQGSPSLPFYENTAMVAKAPPMPPDFIDSHRVQKQSVQEQLLAKHVASQQQQQPTRTNFYNTMPLPVSSSNDNYNNGNNDRYKNSSYNNRKDNDNISIISNSNSNNNYSNGGLTRRHREERVDMNQMTLDFIKELKEKHKLKLQIINKELEEEKKKHLQCKESLKIVEGKNRQHLEDKILYEKTRDEQAKRIQQLQDGLNDAMTRWKQSTTLAVSSINSLKLNVSHGNINNNTLVKYILQLEQCVSKNQYDNGVTMERPDNLLKEPLILAPTAPRNHHGSPHNINNMPNNNAVTPEQLSKHPVVLDAVDKAKELSQQMINTAMQEALSRSTSPQTVNNDRKLYPGMSEPVEVYNKNNNSNNNITTDSDSSPATKDLHSGIYEKVVNSPYKGRSPPRALVEDRTTMLNILFDESSHLQTRERVAKAIAHQFNGSSQIPMDVRDDRTQTLELLFNL